MWSVRSGLNKTHSKIKQLLEACANNDRTTVDKLLSEGVDINETGNVQYPPSFHYPEGLLIEGTSPVLEAVSHNHLNLAQYLISRGANLNHVTTDGYRATHLAGYLWSENALAWLILTKNFDPMQKDGSDYDVFDAVKAGLDDDMLRLRHFSIILRASELKQSPMGLCDAIRALQDDRSSRSVYRIFDPSRPGAEQPKTDINDEKEHLLLIKYMVEYAGHADFMKVIDERGPFYMLSCYDYVYLKPALRYVQLYFDSVKAQAPEETMGVISTDSEPAAVQEKTSTQSDTSFEYPKPVTKSSAVTQGGLFSNCPHPFDKYKLNTLYQEEDNTFVMRTYPNRLLRVSHYQSPIPKYETLLYRTWSGVVTSHPQSEKDTLDLNDQITQTTRDLYI